MADNFDVNSILNGMYRGIDTSILDAKNEYFQSITQAALQAVMNDPSLKVNDAERLQGLREIVNTHGFDLPTIEAPKSKKINSDKLMKLLMYLQLETEDELSKVQQERLEGEKKILDQRHAETRQKLDKNLDAMNKAASSNKTSKILGWVGVAVSVVFAIVVTAVTAGTASAAGAAAVGAATTAATGTGAASGAAAAGAATSGAALGAVGATTAATTTAATMTAAALSTKAAIGIALTWTSVGITLSQQILTETGTMEKMVESLANDLKSGDDSKSKADAQMKAQWIIGGIFMGAALITGAAGGLVANGATKAAERILAEAGKAVSRHIAQQAVGLTGLGLGLATQGVQINNVFVQYNSAIASAEVTESKAMIQLIQQMIEETQEEIQEILEKIDGIIGKMFDILSSSLDAEKEIANQMGQMA